MREDLGILPRPLWPDFERTCPRCERRHALIPMRLDDDERHEKIGVFRCSWCGEESEFALSNPPESV